MRVEALGPEDWRDNRALRLEALRLEPAAFSSTYEDAVNQPDARWRERLANPRCATFMARSGAQPVGMITACRDEDDPGLGFIFGMYVTARHRRRGIGNALLAAGIAHLEAVPGITTIRLWVRTTHHPARMLYESWGFRVVDDAPDDEYLMERPVRR